MFLGPSVFRSCPAQCSPWPGQPVCWPDRSPSLVQSSHSGAWEGRRWTGVGQAPEGHRVEGRTQSWPRSVHSQEPGCRPTQRTDIFSAHQRHACSMPLTWALCTPRLQSPQDLLLSPGRSQQSRGKEEERKKKCNAILISCSNVLKYLPTSTHRQVTPQYLAGGPALPPRAGIWSHKVREQPLRPL